jgi:putative two-component system response regulator
MVRAVGLPVDAITNASGHILIVDDDPQIREFLSRYVSALGYRTTAVEDGVRALAVIHEAPPDVILLDVDMPGVDGYAVCRRLKKDLATRLIPILLITGIGEGHKLEGIRAGADAFLSKPFELADLQATLFSLRRIKFFTDELESAETVLLTLAKSIEAKDPYTGNHCDRLAALAVCLGKSLQLPEATLAALRRGGYLHDIGKIGIPEHILLKAGALTPQERNVMQQHPAIGESICRPLRSLAPVLPIIRHHHERWDGSGYPDGLHGSKIPLPARLLQVVDEYDALTTDRPYRKALTPQKALGILHDEGRKGWLDPDLVTAFRGLTDVPDPVADE